MPEYRELRAAHLTDLGGGILGSGRAHSFGVPSGFLTSGA